VGRIQIWFETYHLNEPFVCKECKYTILIEGTAVIVNVSSRYELYKVCLSADEDVCCKCNKTHMIPLVFENSSDALAHIKANLISKLKIVPVEEFFDDLNVTNLPDDEYNVLNSWPDSTMH